MQRIKFSSKLRRSSSQKAQKLEVTSAVAEDSVERIRQYLGYRLNIKTAELQQSLYRKST